MTNDTDKLLGVVKISVSIETPSGLFEETKALECNGFSLADVGTVIQREAYELLRQVATYGKATKAYGEQSSAQAAKVKKSLEDLLVPGVVVSPPH
jgi:hypothetical protein